MADPSNPNDPTYKNDPHYVWSGGGWRYRSAPGDANYVDPNAPAQGGHVRGSSVVEAGGFLDTMFGNPDRLAADALRRAGVGGEINNFAGYQSLEPKFREGALRLEATNPYNTQIADQSRAAQLALINQMRGQMNGPSLAAMQGQRAMAQSGQQALMQASNPMAQRAAMLQAQSVSNGLAGDVGQARLGEIMRAQGGMGGAAGNLRGADLQSAGAQMNAGFAAQDLADKRARFYAQLGAQLNTARAQAAADNHRLALEKAAQIAGIQRGTLTRMIGAGASAVGTAAGTGAK